ncbi:MAG: gamma-glutamyltransferase [Gemmatimonadota bacterium]
MTTQLRSRIALSTIAFAAACTSTPAPAPTPTPAQRDPNQPVVAANAMVVSASAIASDIGNQVLRNGGNAIDAAIATGFALAVTYPTAGNIGGGGFMVIRFPDGRTTAFDFREKAPLKAHPNMFLDDKGEYSSTIHHNSHIAVGVPGTVAGFALAHEKYGKSKWNALVGPAVKLARDGFAAPPGLARSLAGLANPTGRYAKYPATVQAYTKNGVPYAEGETIRLPDLARTLERIETQGRDGFYKGETARLLAQEMKRGAGLITEEDLARYQARERAPVRGSYRGYDIISMPPPSSGGIAMIEMFNILEGFDLKALGHNSVEHVHYMAEAMRRAFLDRARFVADPDFARVPVERLTSKDYARQLRISIDPLKATPSAPADVTVASESMETTHYSVVDKNGLAVSVTYTLEAGYGSGIVVPGAGFFLNNEMGDFNAKPGLTTAQGLIGTEPNLARPEQRMLSSMTPSIIARDGKLVAVIGSPGGRTIINTVMQVASNIIDFGMNIQQAVNAPRLHHQWLPDRISIEQDGVTPETAEKLRQMGHTVNVGGRQGTAHSIMIDANGRRLGAPDPRDRDAGASGH